MAFLSVRTYYHLLAKDLNMLNLISVLNFASKTKHRRKRPYGEGWKRPYPRKMMGERLEKAIPQERKGTRKTIE